MLSLSNEYRESNMLNITFTPPNPEQRRTLLEEYGFKFDRRIREEDVAKSPAFPAPVAGRWNKRALPPRCHFGRNSCAWLLSDVLVGP
jgi:hypothetical protein